MKRIELNTKNEISLYIYVTKHFVFHILNKPYTIKRNSTHPTSTNDLWHLQTHKQSKVWWANSSFSLRKASRFAWKPFRWPAIWNSDRSRTAFWPPDIFLRIFKITMKLRTSRNAQNFRIAYWGWHRASKNEAQLRKSTRSLCEDLFLSS